MQIVTVSFSIRPYKTNLDIKTIFQFAVSDDGVEQDFSPASQPAETSASAAEVLLCKNTHHDRNWLGWYLLSCFAPPYKCQGMT
jgi:hypothetical protein